MLAHMTSFQKGTATDLVNEKERNLLIELLEGGEKVSLYSPHFKGEEYSEFEKFLLTYKDTYRLYCPSLLMTNKREGGAVMKTNRIMDEIRSTISPEMKFLPCKPTWLERQMELSVAIATICKISAALDAELVKVADYELEPAYA